MEHEVNRDVTDDETRLWSEFKQKSDETPGDSISVTTLAVQRMGLHESRARQLVRTWDNEGLVSTGAGADRAALTEYGRQVDAIVSVNTGGESWR